MGVVGLYLRRKTEEGPEFAALQRYRESTQAKVTPIAEAFRAHWRRILLFTAFMGSWATFATLLTNYLPTFLKANRDLSATAANAANLFASVMVVALVLLFSPIADRIGLRRTMIIGPVVLIVLVIPGFALAGHGVIGGFLGAGILGACKGVLAVPMLLAVSQIFPPGVRVTAGGLGYNVAARSSAGPPPFVAVALNRGTGNSLRFALYLIVFAVVTLVIALVKGRTWVADSEEYSGDISGGTRTQVASRSTT